MRPNEHHAAGWLGAVGRSAPSAIGVISGHVTHPVTAGAGGYLSNLFITETGAIEPSAYGATALALYTGDHVLNDGTIVGAAGSGGAYVDGTNGGYGVSLRGGALLNRGLIEGGRGGASNYEVPGSGGNGMALDGGVVVNQGAILGGEMGMTYSGYGASAGSGVSMAGGALDNLGLIQGGYAGGNSSAGAGVAMSGGVLLNAGTILGSDTGSRDVVIPEQPEATGHAGNTIVQGSSNDAQQMIDAVGVSLSGGDIVNLGIIAGGSGGFASGYEYYGRFLVKGYGGYGGDGAILSGGSLANFGTIEGGTGGNGDKYSAGGSGGDGAVVSSGVLTNTGLILGGDGGGGGQQIGNGGDGVAISGGTLFNLGTIEAGVAGTYAGRTGTAGVGLTITGGTVYDRGTIIGASGSDAVKFGAGPATLELYAGAAFAGAVAGNANDTLVLAGATAGTLDGLGTQFTGFSNLSVKAGSNWTLSGTFYGATNNNGIIHTGSCLTLAGTVGGDGTIAIEAGGTLTLDSFLSAAEKISFGAGSAIDLVGIAANSVTEAGATLTLFSNDTTLGAFSLKGSDTGASFALSSDGHGGTVITHV